MTPKQILEEELKRFDEKFIKTQMWELVPNTPRKIMMSDADVAKMFVDIKSFLHSLTIKILKGDIDRLNKMEKPFCRCLCEKTKIALSYNEALKYQITFLEDEIKLLENKQ